VLYFDCTLYLIRHGQSEGNTQKIVQGQTVNCPLTELGRRQARSVGRHLAKTLPEVHRLISSPLRRALETATIIGGELKYQGKIDVQTALKERSWGDYEGLYVYEMCRRAKVERPAGLRDSVPPGGETRQQVETRVVKWANEQLIQPLMKGHSRPPWMHYVIVTHSDVIRCLMKELCYMDAERVWSQRINNVSISAFHCNVMGGKPLVINAIDHLPKDEQA